jgi:hypothetical protein
VQSVIVINRVFQGVLKHGLYVAADLLVEADMLCVKPMALLARRKNGGQVPIAEGLDISTVSTYHQLYMYWSSWEYSSSTYLELGRSDISLYFFIFGQS